MLDLERFGSTDFGAGHTVMHDDQFFDPLRRRARHALTQGFALKCAAQVQDFVEIIAARIRGAKPALFVPHHQLVRHQKTERLPNRRRPHIQNLAQPVNLELFARHQPTRQKHLPKLAIGQLGR